MGKNYEEMTKEQLKEELNQIISYFRMQACGNLLILQSDIDRLEKVLKFMGCFRN